MFVSLYFFTVLCTRSESSAQSTLNRRPGIGGEVSGHWNIGEYLVPSAHIYMLHIIEKFLFLFRDKWNSLGPESGQMPELSVEERRAEVDAFMRVLISERLSVSLCARLYILTGMEYTYSFVPKFRCA